MNALKKLFGGNTRQFGMIFALVALIVFFEIFTEGRTLTSGNVINLFNGNSYILILAIGMVLVIIAGHIDLSVGSVAAFVGVCVALFIRDWGLPWYIGVLMGLGLGVLIGAWQGFWVAYVGIPAFIVTLAGMLIFRGANQLVGKSNTIPVPTDFQYIGSGYLPEFGPNTGYNNPTMLIGLLGVAFVIFSEIRSRRNAKALGAEVPEAWVMVLKLVLVCGAILYATYLFATGRPGTSFPVPGLILAVLILVYGFISSKTVIGRHIYAVGGNRHAAELSGVQSKKVNFLVMMNMSFLAGLAGMIFVGRSTASGPFDGVGWELDAIAAVFIGGAAVTGGVGTVIGSIIGGLVMAVLNNGLQLLGRRRRPHPDHQGPGAPDRRRVRRLQQDPGQEVRRRHADEELQPQQRDQGRRDHPNHRRHLQGSLSGSPGPRFPDFSAHHQKKVNQAMRMIGKAGKAAAIAAIAALALTACGRSDTGTTGGSTTGGEAFPKGSSIGVALPQKTSENWVLAEQLFNDGLTKAGYKPDVQFANGGVSDQQNQISAMITKGDKVIIVGAIDGAQLGTQLKQAKDAGATIIAYDRLLLNTENVDYYVAYDNFKVGELQGQALLDGMKAKKPEGPYNIELFAGSPDDANAKVFFDGAMSVLKPKIDDGTLKVLSGQTSFEQAVTQGWKAENAQKRMDTLLAGTYGSAPLDGVLSPNDTLARAIITSVKAAGKPIPVVTGQDSEVESVKSIMAGEQYSTINKDTRALVEHSIVMVNDIQAGKKPEINDDKSYNNGVKVVPAYLLEPVIVTQANVHTAYVNDPVLGPITKQ